MENIDIIKKICSKPNIYISFRNSINVSMINPSNDYGTPTGTYTYPSIDFLPEILKCNTIQEFLDIFPFKGRHAPSYIYLYEISKNSNILFNDSTFDEIKPYYEKIIKMFKKEDLNEKIIKNLIEYVDKIPDEPEESFFGVNIKSYSLFNSYDIKNAKGKESYKFWTLTYHLADDDPTKWGNMLRRIGLEAFVDHGDGTIHQNEPIQAVLLTPKIVINKTIIELDDVSESKNNIKKCLLNGDSLDMDDLEKIYKKDPSFVLNALLKKTQEKDFHYVKTYAKILADNKFNKIVNNIMDIYYNNLDDSKIDRMDDDLMKFLIDLYGDDFYRKYIKLYLNKKEKYVGMGETIDIKRKLIVGSLLNANKKKTIQFFNDDKLFDFKEELEFFEENPSLIKKYKDINSYYFSDHRWELKFSGESAQEKKDREELEHRYELFKNSYEKATGYAWDFDKFKQRSENWDFYGDYNGYIAVRHQTSGYYKLVGSAGDYRSVIRGMNELIKRDVPIWGMMTDELCNLLVKKYNFHMPPKSLFKILFKLIYPKMTEDVELDDDGGVVFNYEGIGEMKKYFVANKKYYLALLDNDFFEKNKFIRGVLKIFANKLS